MQALLEHFARLYGRAVADTSTDVVNAWGTLGDVLAARATNLETQYTIIRVPEEEPYQDAESMFGDLDGGRLRVSTANCDHPLWSTDVNIASRIVHDIDGHYAAHLFGVTGGAGFDWAGEVNAYRFVEESNIFLDNARDALMRRAHLTETLGQVSYRLLNGRFRDQVCCFLD